MIYIMTVSELCRLFGISGKMTNYQACVFRFSVMVLLVAQIIVLVMSG